MNMFMEFVLLSTICMYAKMKAIQIWCTIDWENFIIKKVTWNKSSTRFNFVKAETIVCISIKKLQLLWVLILDHTKLFNDEIFPIYGMCSWHMYTCAFLTCQHASGNHHAYVHTYIWGIDERFDILNLACKCILAHVYIAKHDVSSPCCMGVLSV